MSLFWSCLEDRPARGCSFAALYLLSPNHKNAGLSTGPRTPEGKAASSRNALKFGLTAQQIILPGENPAHFEALHAGLAAQLKPATDLECMLLDDIAAAEWRFRRVEAAQNGWLAIRAERGIPASRLLLSDDIRKFQKYAASYRRERESAWRKLAALQKERKAEEQRHAQARELQIKPKPIAQSATCAPPATVTNATKPSGPSTATRRWTDDPPAVATS